MLRIVQNQNAEGAKRYFSRADYYVEAQELVGRWGGNGTVQLGLQGEVTKEHFEALCDNLHPFTRQQLTPRHDEDRTVGYDFTFSSPKGVSLAYALTKDERIMDAFRASVRETMDELEADMKTRVRRGHRDAERSTGNICYAEFVHLTARPVDGIPDPHLHAHCFVLNATHDDKEDRWKAGQFRDIKRDAPYFEAAFYARLGKRLQKLGYDIERVGKQWDLAAIPRSLSRKFSRRTDQIEKLAQEKGITNADQKAALGAKSRENKTKELTMPELWAIWNERLADEDRRALKEVSEVRHQRPMLKEQPEATAQALDHALAHCFERQSVVPKRAILAEALRYGVGQVDVEQAKEQLGKTETIVRSFRGREMATTRSVLAEERAMLNWAQRGQGQVQPLNSNWEIKRQWLDAGQQAAVQHVLQNRDRVAVIKGSAGTGKTSLMQEAVEGIRVGGHEVFVFAPSAQASRKVLQEEGFENATTVAALLVNEQLQRNAAGQVLWIDEAGLLGTRTLKRVFDLADRLDCRVILSGDWSQHGSVERGAALRLLEQEAGLVPACVTQIHRQQGDYREVVRLLAEGLIAEGFDKLDQLGWVQEIPDGERESAVARDYADGVSQGTNTLVVCPTHSEGNRITEAIRSELKTRKLLGSDERLFPRLVPLNLTAAERADATSYVAGDVIVFHQNAKGHQKGERIVVNEKLSADVLQQAERFQAYRQAELPLAGGDKLRVTAGGQTKDGHRLNNGAVYEVKGFTSTGDLRLSNGWTIDRQWGHFAPGYVVTSHASQGRGEPRVILVESSRSLPAASREQFYVSVSRGKNRGVTVYTDDKRALREAIVRSDERLGATELVKGRGNRLKLLRRLEVEQNKKAIRPRKREKTKELVHEHD